MSIHHETLLALRIRVAQYLYAKGKSPWSDAEFDQMADALRAINPNHEFFHRVGAKPSFDVAFPGTKRKLPVPVGSLEKLRPNEIRKWAKRLSAAMRERGFAVTPKLDGMSLLLCYDAKGVLKFILTRGDGVTGQDVTQWLWDNPTIPRNIWPRNCNVYIRGEFILSKQAFAALQSASEAEAKKSKQRAYVNPRNMLVGCVGAKTHSTLQRQVIMDAEFFAFDVRFDAPAPEQPKIPMGESYIRADKAPISVRRKWLSGNFKVPPTNITKYSDSKAWKGRARQNIKNLTDAHPYEIDGMVIAVDCESPEKLGYEANGLNPKWERAIKLDVTDQDSHTVEVGQVLWQVSPRGIYKPVVRLKFPATFRGVQVRNVSADNAGYVRRNKVAPGALVTVIRSGDVIPRIVRVEMKSGLKGEYPRRCRKHDVKLEWTDTKVDLFCPVCAGKLNSPSDFFHALDTDNVGKKLVIKACEQLKADDIPTLMAKLGKLNGKPGWGDVAVKKFSKSLHKALGQASMAKLMHASGAFRSVKLGLGETRLMAILDQVRTRSLFKHYDADMLENPDRRALSALALKAQEAEGVGRLAGDCFAMQMPHFFRLWETIKPFCPKAQSEVEGVKARGILKGKRYAFTGFRNKQIENFIRDEGGIVTGSINEKLTALFAPDPKGMSAKIKKARELKVEIIAGDQAWSYINTTDVSDAANKERKRDKSKKVK